MSPAALMFGYDRNDESTVVRTHTLIGSPVGGTTPVVSVGAAVVSVDAAVVSVAAAVVVAASCFLSPQAAATSAAVASTAIAVVSFLRRPDGAECCRMNMTDVPPNCSVPVPQRGRSANTGDSGNVARIV